MKHKKHGGRAWLIVAALSGAFALACGGSGPRTAPSLSEPPPPKKPPRTHAEAKPERKSAVSDEQRHVNRVLRSVSKLRGLSQQSEVHGEALTPEQMVEYVRAQLKEEIPEQVILASNELFFALGVVKANFDYELSLLKLMGSELAGFYDPKHKTMYLRSELDGMNRHITLVHELVHALQDQHYDLGKIIAFREDGSDEQSALHALAEGDATSLMLDEILQDSGKTALDMPDEVTALQMRAMTASSPELSDVPGIIKRSVIAPYVDGLLFVHELRRKGGWPAVDAAWKNPPQSTEQLLHIAKFEAREAPEVVPVPAAATRGQAVAAPATVTYHDVMGEQSLRLLFEEWMPARSAAEAADDWAGDRGAVFIDGELRAVAWRIRYDTPKAAAEGLVAMGRGILTVAAKGPSAKDTKVTKAAAERAVQSGSLCRERPDAGPYAVARSGRDLAVTVGPFRRSDSGSVSSTAKCTEALSWARQILQQ